MTVEGLIVADHLASLLSGMAWLGSGAAAASGRRRTALALLAVAVAATMARAGLALPLSSQGWWFVQEKVLLTLPLAMSTAVLAVTLAVKPLLAAGRPPATTVVALLAAAYAALAGFVLTFFVGYPLSTVSAVATVAVVAAGAALTARAVPQPAAPSTPGLSRRTLLTVAAAAVGATAVGVGSAVTGARLRPPTPKVWPTTATPNTVPISIADLRGATSAAPGGTVRRHIITAQKSRVELPSATAVDAWTFDGRLPGPALTATQGDLLEVTLRNRDIEDGVTLHWHGYDLACGEDGAPGLTQLAVRPGEDFTYHFRADQVGTYWFHTHQVSAIGVRKGLYGTLVVHPSMTSTDETPILDLTFPVHTIDGAVLVGDRATRTDYAAAASTKVRLRLINTDSDPHRFTLSGTSFQIAAVDGRDLNEPGQVREHVLSLPAGGRIDVSFDMPASSVALTVDQDRDAGVRLVPEGRQVNEPFDSSRWPELDLLSYGAPTKMPFDPDRPQRRFTIVLDRGLALVDGVPAYAYTVNGRAHPSIPDQVVAEGEVVGFTIVNRTLETHPWHLHGHPVLILSRNGVRSTGSPLWMDSFDVRPGDVWEVAFQANNRGIWMNHCHNLPHADQGMMLKLAYAGVSSPFDHAHGLHA